MSPRQRRACAVLSHLCARVRPADPSRAAVLCYHSVHPDLPFRSCTPALFERHLRWLAANCRVLPLEELLDARSPGPKDGKPGAAITFDDGHADNYQYALPLLERYGVPATFFLTAGYIDRDPEVMGRFQFLRRAPAADLEPLTWTQVREMAGLGFAVGGHTYSHANLTHLNSGQLEFEIRHGRELLQQRTGQPVNVFAYPFGRPGTHYDAEISRRVGEAGYRWAVTLIHRRLRAGDSPWAVPRFSISGETEETLEDILAGGCDWVGFLHAKGPLWLGRMFSPRGYLRETYGPPYSGAALSGPDR